MKTEEKAAKPRTGIVHFERRKYPRFSVDLPVEYCRADSSSSYGGRALNASEGGLLVDFPEPMDIGQQLNLKLFISSDSGLNAIEVLGEVVWMDMHFGKDWGDYRSGVKFVNISPEDRNGLKSFLVSLSES
ncbi:MAG: PilZ domain-containing protein [Thermodesulfobacteriota bacterium]